VNFDQAVEIILKKEGGYVNHPKDPGGETNFGIAKKFYPHLDIKNLTVEQAKEIYLKEYWLKIQADLLPSYLRLIAFDCAVNQGVGFCLDSLRYLAGERTGTPMKVVAAKLQSSNQDQIENAFVKRRMDRYAANKNFKTFGKGWTNRLFEIAKISGFDVGNA
jgi:lysozyme family protein